MLEHNVWDQVQMPKGQNVVGCKWIIKKKIDDKGKIEWFKARLVA